MKHLASITAYILAIALLFSACKGTEAPPTPDESTTESQTTAPAVQKTGDGKVALPVNFADSLNPFFAQSYENQIAAGLMFERLFAVNEKQEVINELATAVKYEGNRVFVTVNPAPCRGSSPINAGDVVYSFNLAKASYAYSGRLSTVLSAEAQSANVAVFTMAFPDTLAAGKLIFPVVKAGTADSREGVPTGSGDYYYSDKKLLNAEGETVYLYEISNNESAENAFKIGLTDLYFNDMSNCEYINLPGTTEEVSLNSMVYLGFNSSIGALDKYVRSAAAVCIDSADIARSVYQGHAAASKYPQNPEKEGYSLLDTVKTEGDIAEGSRILDSCGYMRYAGKAKTNGSFVLSYSLIVNSENKYRVAAAYSIADALNQAGFYIRVAPLSFADYSERIKSGNFEMYLGEVRQDASYDLSCFFSEGGSLSAGIDRASPASVKYFEYRAGKIDGKAYSAVFSEEMPFVPICYRQGYAVGSGDLPSAAEAVRSGI